MRLTGPMASFSGNYFRAFEMGLEDACKKENVDCKQFKLDPQDNAGQATQTVSVLQKQLLDNPTVYVSVFSAQSQAITPMLDNTTIPHRIQSFNPFIVPQGHS